MDQDRAKLIVAVLVLALFIGLVTILYQEQQAIADQDALYLYEIYNPQPSGAPR